MTEVILGTLRHMVKSDESVDPSMPFHTIESFINDLCSSRHPRLLNWAAKGGYFSAVRFLIDQGADPGHESYSYPLLKIVAGHGYAEIAKLLLAIAPLHIAEKADSDGTSLYIATSRGHLKSCKVLLLGTDQGYIEQRDNTDMTAFQDAAYRGHCEIVKLFIALGHADWPYSADISDRTTALARAANMGNEETVKFILEHNGCILGQNPQYETSALRWGYTSSPSAESMIKLFLNTGQIDMYAENAQHGTLLEQAPRKGHHLITKFFDFFEEVGEYKQDKKKTPLVTTRAEIIFGK